MSKVTIAIQRYMKILWALILLFWGSPAWAGEADLVIPDLSSVTFLNIDGRTLLLSGIAICVFGLIFGLRQFLSLKMPAHRRCWRSPNSFMKPARRI